MLDLLVLLLLGCAAPAGAAPPAGLPLLQDVGEEYERRRAAAEGDPKRLWELADWCEARGLMRERDLTLRAILELDEEDAKAHQLLGHVLHGGTWFPSQSKLDAHLEKEAREERRKAAREAKAKDWVAWGDTFVAPEDLPYLEHGLVRGSDGTWLAPADIERLEAGWERQDLEWIAPEDVPKLNEGLWKCGEEWAELGGANRYHAELGRWWRIPGDGFTLYTTCRRELALQALQHMDIAYRDLVRFFGVEPTMPPVVLLLSSRYQYRSFSSEMGELGSDSLGISSMHGAYFADRWYEDGRFMEAGVAFWDEEDEVQNRFGVHFARHAAGQSFVESLDPSPNTLAKRESAEVPGFDGIDFWNEKTLPTWLRMGAATYVERYYVDPFVLPGEDGEWTRKWSVENIQRLGGLDDVERVFNFPLTSDAEVYGKSMKQAGLVVAFVLDGECEPVVKAHERFKSAMQGWRANPKKGKKELTKSIEALERAVVKNEDALREFAGL